MTEHDQTPWEPDPIPSDAFHEEKAWVNINRAPHDRISDVIYKRIMNIKCVAYEPASPAPDMPPPWQGEGRTLVRWLFSEEEGTTEGLLKDARFAFLKDMRLDAGASTGQRSPSGKDVILYTLSGDGMLYHRPTEGSPVVARPLRPGDAVLVYRDELYSLANEAEAPLRLILLGLSRDV